MRCIEAVTIFTQFECTCVCMHVHLHVISDELCPYISESSYTPHPLNIRCVEAMMST